MSAEYAAALTVIAELNAYWKRWEAGGAAASEFLGGIEPVNAGHALHAAVVALEDARVERGRPKMLWHPAATCWRGFLFACRRGRFAALAWGEAFSTAIREHYRIGDVAPSEIEAAISEARKTESTETLQLISANTSKILAFLEAQESRRLAALPNAEGNDELPKPSGLPSPTPWGNGI